MTEQLQLYQPNVTIHRCTNQSNSRNIQDILLTIGMPSNLLGFHYIMSALHMIQIDPDYLRCITKGLYCDIATKYDTTPSRVERAMRHAIATTWLNGDIKYINYLFKNCVNPQKNTPSNSLFLARMYYFLNNK